MMTGLEPREFTWVISGRLAVSERIGGHGFQHRRIRREEELSWMRANGVTAILSLLDGNQNLAAYEAAGFTVGHTPLVDLEPDAVRRVFEAIHGLVSEPGAALLVHRDLIDDPVAGLMAGYLVYSGLVGDPIVATAAIQEILKRPLGPDARGIIPAGAGI